MNKTASKNRRRSWWRKDAAVVHSIHGEGAITNFVKCPPGHANVYFYKGDNVLNDIPRYTLEPIRPRSP